MEEVALRNDIVYVSLTSQQVFDTACELFKQLKFDSDTSGPYNRKISKFTDIKVLYGLSKLLPVVRDSIQETPNLSAEQLKILQELLKLAPNITSLLKVLMGGGSPNEKHTIQEILDIMLMNTRADNAKHKTSSIKQMIG